jgi:DNA (cytosine-5)-methyltransferase 1
MTRTHGPKEARPTKTVRTAPSLRTVGLFAGIGGLELGLRRHGHPAILLSEINAGGQAVLRARFPDTPVEGDVRGLERLPACDLVTAGFPCQDLSQCGKTGGIEGKQSSLVREVFRLVEKTAQPPEWILLENVPFMLRLDRGRAMTLITSELARLGYKWAYRTVDARAFGLPQRRLRVVLVAARTRDPLAVLFADDAPEPRGPTGASAFGFYWTEGSRGLGWASDAVPTLKGGSGLGIPSPPAIWIPSERSIVTIDLRDAERLQGFPTDWTKPAEQVEGRAGARWRLVGNAVCVRVAAWVGKRLASPAPSRCPLGAALQLEGAWPPAACGDCDGARAVIASTWPVSWLGRPILEFLRHPLKPLSRRAASGFLSRARKSRLKFAANFLNDLETHLATTEGRR